jgi:hypothetical protein
VERDLAGLRETIARLLGEGEEPYTGELRS